MTGGRPGAAPDGGDIEAAEPVLLMPSQPPARRFRQLPLAVVRGRVVRVAQSRRARLLGLAFLDCEQADGGLLIPRCSSVHTFGMRFALDLVFLDAGGQPLAIRRGVAPCRVVSHRGAAAVLELPAGARPSSLCAKSRPEGGESSSRLP
jgi:uncharacterized membrane protein (UPF0127 family)